MTANMNKMKTPPVVEDTKVEVLVADKPLSSEE